MTDRIPELFTRYGRNPILTAADWPYRMNSVFNPAATILADGTTLLLCRVEDRRGLSHLCAARSPNGVDRWVIDPQPTFPADPERFPEELWGVEDPRITYLPEVGRYAVVYTSYSAAGPGVSLAFTADFRTFERFGVLMQPDDKDAALLPRRINGRWVLIHRPADAGSGHIWLSYSSDFHHWSGPKKILEARRGAWWDANKIGLSPPPLETPEGWLVVYHGVKQYAAGAMYRLGLALFALDDPERCLKRSEEWVFGPEAPYELHGDVDKVVFPCGLTVGADGDTVRMYYGAADKCVALATASLRALLKKLDDPGRPKPEAESLRPS